MSGSGGTLTTTIKWRDGVSFAAETGSGHTVTMDGAPEAGGKNQGARPMELVLAALGGCGSFDVVTALRTAGQDVQGLEVRIEGERVQTTPGVFRRIRMLFVVRGANLDEAAVKQAVADSATKYSSVMRMMEQTVDIVCDYRIAAASPDGED